MDLDRRMITWAGGNTQKIYSSLRDTNEQNVSLGISLYINCNFNILSTDNKLRTILLNYESTVHYQNLLHLTTSKRSVMVRVADFNLAGPGSNPIEYGVFLNNCVNYQRTIKGSLETPLNIPIMHQVEKPWGFVLEPLFSESVDSMRDPVKRVFQRIANGFPIRDKLKSFFWFSED